MARARGMVVDLADVGAFGSLAYGAARGEKEKMSDDGGEHGAREPLIGKRGHRRMHRLKTFSLTDYVSDPADRPAPHGKDGGGIDGSHLTETLVLRHVGCWVVLIQVVTACTAAALSSTLIGAALPRDGRGALRCLIASAAVGLLLLARPFLVTENTIQRVAPLRRLYKCLRPSLGFVVCDWCANTDTPPTSPV